MQFFVSPTTKPQSMLHNNHRNNKDINNRNRSIFHVNVHSIQISTRLQKGPKSKASTEMQSIINDL